MSQHDLVIQNQAGMDFRIDVQDALRALTTLQAGATEPSATYAYQLWYDTNALTLKQRNSGNSAWASFSFGISAATLAAAAFGPFTSIASAGTTDLSTVATVGASITGTTTITSFGTGANLLRIIKFGGALTLTHNATSLILPGGASITTAAGDRAIALSDGSGNWTVVVYTKANGKSTVLPAFSDLTGNIASSQIPASVLAALAFGPFTSIASAGTTDLSTVATVGASITGTTTITSFGTGANLLRIIKFGGALTLTHNATSLILPGGANITTVAGDTVIALSDASGNWTVVKYSRADGSPIGTVPKSLGGTGTTTGAREILLANRTYYVRTDGSNSNTGLVNNSGGAFLTLQKAYDVICGTLDLAGFTVTVQIGDGTYTGTLDMSQPWTGGGAVTFQGNSGTPANVIISTTSADAFKISAPLPGVLTIKDMKVQTTTSGSGINISAPAVVKYGNMNFGACAEYHVIAQAPGAQASGISNYTISGGAVCHWVASVGANITCQSRTITISGTPAFSFAFAYGSRTGNMVVNANTFSGSGTGARYNADANGVVFTNGGGASYLPGNSAGSTATGGQYI